MCACGCEMRCQHRRGARLRACPRCVSVPGGHASSVALQNSTHTRSLWSVAAGACPQRFPESCSSAEARRRRRQLSTSTPSTSWRRGSGAGRPGPSPSLMAGRSRWALGGALPALAPDRRCRCWCSGERGTTSPDVTGLATQLPLWSAAKEGSHLRPPHHPTPCRPACSSCGAKTRAKRAKRAAGGWRRSWRGSTARRRGGHTQGRTPPSPAAAGRCGRRSGGGGRMCSRRVLLRNFCSTCPGLPGATSIACWCCPGCKKLSS